MGKLSLFLKEDKGYIVSTAYLIEIYIPEKYFDLKLAESIGTNIETVGLLNIRVFDEKEKMLVDEILNLPTNISISPTNIVTKDINMLGNEYDEIQRYKVAQFFKGDKIMPVTIPQNSAAVSSFLNMVLSKKISKSVSYDKLLEVWLKNLDLNGLSLNVPPVVMEFVLAEMNRGPDGDKFSKSVAKNPKISRHAYTPANITEVCARNSTFAAITYRDMDAMITASLNMKNYNKKQVESPIEKIIKM